MSYQLIEDYKENLQLKESFNELAQLVFQLDFKPWYQRDAWGENYICYSFADEGKIIANVSVHKMDLSIAGKAYHTIQIGTVMTHPDYIGQGLARQLMDYVIGKYEPLCDFIYLFANDEVLDFYPKFGFARVNEWRAIQLVNQPRKAKTSELKKLSIDHQEDWLLLKDFVKNAHSQKANIEVFHNTHLLLFYFIVVFKDAIYYIEALDVIVLYSIEQGDLQLFDVIGKAEVDLNDVLDVIVDKGVEKIVFHFMPNLPTDEFETSEILDLDDVLFVRGSDAMNLFSGAFMFPVTSHG
ncbi:GNAT family N-acetyltransferase [Isobaculum melis]|uniref:Acetyltransferase (GNAT) domain-containing protein n=1 Tax=Isobaculum melis TaxID=142588 RepID=A0A1H9SQI6_9LACT|nr:GNAT family N-acetyltransferase [Isobaculum melis]SER87282.1 Acetyltransferase (GNAT) domain-containing protein [Isobaculum melis]